MIHADSFHAGYRAGYHDGQHDLQRQILQIATQRIIVSGSQPARALADAVAAERMRDEDRQD